MEWRAAQLNSLQFTHGMVSCAEWTGVKLSTLFDEVGLKKEATWALVEGADAAEGALHYVAPVGLNPLLHPLPREPGRQLFVFP